jgi:hypothetical protein
MSSPNALLRATALALSLAVATLPIAGVASAQSRIAPGTPVIVRFNDGSTVDWPGTADRIGTDGRIFVKFSGAVAPDDQWVDAKLVRANGNAPTPAHATATGYRVGEQVQVDWKGTWYKGTILEAASGRYKIRYAGYDASWDEWVPPARLRKTTQPTAAEQKAANSPVGRYQCATFDAGQLNIVAEFTLAANGTYVDSFRKGSGRYSYDAKTGRIRFLSGPQKTSAPVRFEPKGPRGRPYIAITYPGGAKLDCYR